jgi:hypothetical protein
MGSGPLQMIDSRERRRRLGEALGLLRQALPIVRAAALARGHLANSFATSADAGVLWPALLVGRVDAASPELLELALAREEE